MQKRITLAVMAFLLMMNMYIGVIYAVENTTENQAVAQNTTTTEKTASEENEEKNETTENIATEVISTVVEAKGVVIEAGQVKKITNGSVEDTVQTIKLKILNGEYENQEFTTDYVLSYDVEGKILAYELKEGNKVTVQIAEDTDGSISVTIEDIQRVGYVYAMFILLLIAIIGIGGKQGIKAAVSLVITILALYFILIKSIFSGANAVFASIMTSLVVMTLTSIITIGFNKKSLTATVGSFAGSIVAGALANIFGYLAKLSGATEEAIQLSLNLKTVAFNFRELIFATIVVSSIGACMDIGVSIVNSLDEMRSRTEDFSWKELFKNGMKVGREVVGTMSNTLILVYIGGMMKIILLYMACNMQMSYIMSKEAFAEQIILAMAGSIGVVCTVPLTAMAYAFINRKKTIYRTISDNKIDGKRSLKI